MIIRKLGEAVGTSREVATPNWTSRRLLLRDDDLGFSFHDTVIREGSSTRMCYRNHVEAVYCVAGRGRLRVEETGETVDIEPGTLYALDRQDEHVLTADEELRMICVFNPPLVGQEVHDETGAYPSATTGNEEPDTQVRGNGRRSAATVERSRNASRSRADSQL